MPDYGTITQRALSDLPRIGLNPLNFSQTDIGVNYTGNIFIMPIDPRHGVIIPIIGQLWPRHMWHYNDDLAAPAGTLGYVTKVYEYYQYGIIRNKQYTGQLWPRGDYIANATNEVKNG